MITFGSILIAIVTNSQSSVAAPDISPDKAYCGYSSSTRNTGLSNTEDFLEEMRAPLPSSKKNENAKTERLIEELSSPLPSEKQKKKEVTNTFPKAAYHTGGIDAQNSQ
jgi:hypothetical protein